MSSLKYIMLFMLLVWLVLVPANVTNASPTTQSVSLSGVFTILWGDPAPGSNGTPSINYFLTDARGNVIEILPDERVTDAVGGVLELNGQRVTLVGTTVMRPQADGQPPLFRMQAIQAVEKISSPTLEGAQPWISIGCKFADVSAEPRSTAYFQEMYKSTYPGLDHYWREQSYNRVNVTGSYAVAWFTLPNPKSYYAYSDGELNLSRFAADCSAAADSVVYFPNYVGINLMLNVEVGSASWGGLFSLNLDGLSKSYRTTWLLPWAYTAITAVEHEMGHGFGLPHSSGKYNQTYDNQWDVMSDLWSNCELSRDPVYDCLGQHTIGFHKSWLGWTTPLWLFSGTQTINLGQLALPQIGTMVVAIPIGGSNSHYYTVEVRRRTGYDIKLPGEGVIIHEINGRAFVLDSDNNGNTGDNGAIWRPGELFADRANAIYVCVNAETAYGFNVTVASGSEPPCTQMTPTPKPGRVTALSAAVIDLRHNPVIVVAPDGWITYRGDYQASFSSPQNLDFSFDVVGPCGVFYSIRFSVAEIEPGNGYVLAPGYFNIPNDVCGGQYTVTFGVVYNGISEKSSEFTMLWSKTPTATATRTVTPTITPTPTYTPDGNWIYCARENMSCDLPGERLARFGANAIYAYKKLSGSFVCNTTTFGADPLPGVPKHCDYSSDPNEPTPTHTTTQTPNYTATPTSTLAPTPTYTATPTTPVTCATKPVKPVLASPKDGALIRKGQALLKWQAAPCADTYIVVIQDQQTHQRIEKQAGLVTLQYHTEKLEPASAYRWKVIAVNAYGRSSSKWREMRTK